MKKFFKDYLGLLAAVGLAGGSLFAFNISTSIDNALQVIKTIWVTSDGTTSNPPFVTMDGSGKYVSIGTTASGETLNVSGTAYIQNGNRGWEHLAEQLYTGIQNIGGRYRSGTQLWHQGVAITNGPLSYVRWTDDSNNNEMIAQINQDSAGLKYSDNRQLQSLGQTFSNLIGVARDKLEVMFDMYNFNGYRNGITIDQDGLFYENETGPIHTFDRSGHVGINTINPSENFALSGTFNLQYNDNFGYNALFGYNDPWFNGGLGFLYGGASGSTMLGIFPSGADKIGAMINNDTPNTASSMAVEPGSASITRSIDTANSIVNQLSVNDSGLTITTSGNQSFWFTKDQRFGARTSNPANTIDISQTAIPGTLGLRLASGPGNSGQILGVNDDGDVVMLGNIGGFGGGGPNYWTQNGNDLYPSTLTNNLGIGTSTPSETLVVSGTMISTFTDPYGIFGLVANATIFGGNPGAGSYVSSSGEFLFAGVDHDGSKLSAELVYSSGDVSQFISVSEEGPSMFWQSTFPSLHKNGLNITSTGVKSFIRSMGIGPAAFTWEIDSGNELMRLTNEGFVGIGLDNPAVTLHVNGAIASSQSTISGSFVGMIDVSGSNTVGLDTSNGDITIQGLCGGTAGQIVIMTKISSANEGGFVHEYSGTLPSGCHAIRSNGALVADTLVTRLYTGSYRSHTFVFHGEYWYVVYDD